MKDGMFEIDLEKVRALAKPSHNSCRGTGVTGVVRGTNIHRICACVYRSLRRRSVANAEAWQFIQKDPPAESAVAAE